MSVCAILISGRGSNMLALLDLLQDRACQVVVIADREAEGLDLAQERGILTYCIQRSAYTSRGEFEQALHQRLLDCQVDLVCLAGFMCILSASFLAKIQHIINIHPSLLPAYPGLNTHARVLEAGGLVHGCTVHFVISEVDQGAAIVQGVVPVAPEESEISLAARVLKMEHRIYPMAVDWYLKGWIRKEGARICCQNDQGEPLRQLIFE